MMEEMKRSLTKYVDQLIAKQLHTTVPQMAQTDDSQTNLPQHPAAHISLAPYIQPLNLNYEELANALIPRLKFYQCEDPSIPEDLTLREQEKRIKKE